MIFYWCLCLIVFLYPCLHNIIIYSTSYEMLRSIACCICIILGLPVVGSMCDISLYFSVDFWVPCGTHEFIEALLFTACCMSTGLSCAFLLVRFVFDWLVVVYWFFLTLLKKDTRKLSFLSAFNASKLMFVRM